MRTYLDFEKPIAELESKVAELKALAAEQRSVLDRGGARQARDQGQGGLGGDLCRAHAVAEDASRPPSRAPAFPPLHRRAGAGLHAALRRPRLSPRTRPSSAASAGCHGRSVMVIGHEKGSDTEGRIKHNFGMARPEGYRKAVRLMEMADRFSLPVVSLVDTAGAYPGIGAEERGQAEAIARSTDCCLSLGVPIVSVIIGEGGSGGAVAIATANRIYMLEHSIYTVASPEAAASILWKDSTRAVDAATNMKITAQDLLKLGIIDGIIPEPIGGAHRDGVEVVRGRGRDDPRRAGRLRRPLAGGDSQGPAREIPVDGPRQLAAESAQKSAIF